MICNSSKSDEIDKRNDSFNLLAQLVNISKALLDNNWEGYEAYANELIGPHDSELM